VDTIKEDIFRRVASKELDPASALRLLKNIHSVEDPSIPLSAVAPRNHGPNSNISAANIVSDYLLGKISKELSIESADLDIDINLMDLGLESTSLLNLSDTIESELNITLYPTIFFEYQTLSEVIGYFTENHENAFLHLVADSVNTSSANGAEPSHPEPIPVVSNSLPAKNGLSSGEYSGSTRTRILDYFVTKIAAIADVSSSEIDTNANLMELGLESTILINLSDTLESELDIVLYPTVFFEYTTLTEIAGYFHLEHEDAFRRYWHSQNVDETIMERQEILDESEAPRIDATKSELSLNYYTHDWFEVGSLKSFTKAGKSEHEILYISNSPVLLECVKDNGSGRAPSRVCLKTGIDETDAIRWEDELSGIDSEVQPIRISYILKFDSVTRENSREVVFSILRDLARLYSTKPDSSNVNLVMLLQGRSPFLGVIQSSVSAFLKSVAREFPKGKIALLHGNYDDDCIQKLSITLHGQCSNQVLILKTDSINVSCENVVEIKGPASSFTPPTLRNKGVYVITGGSGKIALQLSHYLINRYSACVILCGRRSENKVIEALRHSAKSAGACVDYEQCDVGSRSAVERMLHNVRARFGTINGIFHVAGLTNDSLLNKKDVDASEKVIDSKIQGILNLDEFTRLDPLDIFVCFSSISAFIGNRGQTDYALANGYMDGFAHYRSALENKGLRSGNSVSIGWPLWTDGGMRPDERVTRIVHNRLGMATLDSELAFKAMEQCLSLGVPHTALFCGDSAKINDWLTNQPTNFDFLSNQLESEVKTQPIMSNKRTAVQKVAEDDIAVIGMDSHFPGSANNDEFLKNLLAGKDLISSELERWKLDNYIDLIGVSLDDLSEIYAGFVNDVDKFDAEFFSISPAEAGHIDPQQRMFLQAAWRTIEDAGYNPKSFSGKKVGVYVGASTRDYQSRLEALLPSLKLTGYKGKPYGSTALATNNIANRVSYFLDLRGPSEVVDTACSSSLVAMNTALKSLRSGETTMCIVGGVNSLLVVNTFLAFKNAGLLSADMRCRAFAKNANGYVRGEGVGAVLLKPLSAAISDRDNIHGVIRGASVNHGGKVQSLTAPNPIRQSEVIESAVESAAVDPQTITYIEAHGTGTALGDSVEVRGINKAFESLFEKRNQAPPEEPFCTIGSVKSNIGHLEAAAGIAGVIKTLLSMRAGVIPQSLHLDEINPYLELDNSPIDLAAESKPWTRLLDEGGSNIPRRAGISSFGFGGTNAHIVLEEAPLYLSESPQVPSEGASVCLVLSARNASQLKQYAKDLSCFLEMRIHDDLCLNDIAYTLQTGRPAFEYRLAINATSLQSLRELLVRFSDEQDHQNIFRSTAKVSTQLKSVLTEQALDVLVEHLARYDPAERISKLWCEGIDINWEVLYKDKKPNRISLPAYPFEQTSHWLPSGNKTVEGEKGSHTKSEENTTVVAASENTYEEIIDFVVDELSTALGVDRSSIDDDKSLSELGMDSILGMKLLDSLESQFSVKLFTSEILKHDSVGKLAKYIFDECSLKPVEPIASFDEIKDTTSVVTGTANSLEVTAPTNCSEEELPFGTKEEVEHTIVGELSIELQIERKKIHVDQPFIELGMDSILGMKLLDTLETRYNIKLFSSEVLTQDTISRLATHIAKETTLISEQGLNQANLFDPVFILCCPRSGSTLLRSMLMGSPSLFAPPELHLLNYETMQQRESAVSKLGIGDGLIETMAELAAIDIDSSKKEVSKLVSEDANIEDMYQKLMGLAYPRRLVDKSPIYASSVSTLKRAVELFPNARYIYLVRRPEAVIKSLIENRFHRLIAPSRTDEFAVAEEVWRQTNSNIQSFLRQIEGGRWTQIVYEELVEGPKNELKRICDFLDIEYSQEMLDPYAPGRMINGLHSESRSVGDPNFLTRQKIESQLATRWAKSAQLGHIEQQTQTIARQAGYDLGPSFPLLQSAFENWCLIQRYNVQQGENLTSAKVCESLCYLSKIYPILSSRVDRKNDQLVLDQDLAPIVKEISIDDVTSEVNRRKVIREEEKVIKKVIDSQQFPVGVLLINDTSNAHLLFVLICNHHMIDGISGYLVMEYILKACHGAFSNIYRVEEELNNHVVKTEDQEKWNACHISTFPSRLKLPRDKERLSSNVNIKRLVVDSNVALQKLGKDINPSLNTLGQGFIKMLSSISNGQDSFVVSLRYHGRLLPNDVRRVNSIGNLAYDLPIVVDQNTSDKNGFLKAIEAAQMNKNYVRNHDLVSSLTDVRFNFQELRDVKVGEVRAFLDTSDEYYDGKNYSGYLLDVVYRRQDEGSEIIVKYDSSSFSKASVVRWINQWLSTVAS